MKQLVRHSVRSTFNDRRAMVHVIKPSCRHTQSGGVAVNGKGWLAQSETLVRLGKARLDSSTSLMASALSPRISELIRDQFFHVLDNACTSYTIFSMGWMELSENRTQMVPANYVDQSASWSRTTCLIIKLIIYIPGQTFLRND